MELILVPTVIAAMIAAVVSLVVTLLTSWFKTKDSARLFRYEKLYELFNEYLQLDATTKERDDLPERGRYFIQLGGRRMNLIHSYEIAKLLVDKKHLKEIDVALENASTLYVNAEKALFVYRDHMVKKMEDEIINESYQLIDNDAGLKRLELEYRISENNFAKSVYSLKGIFVNAMRTQVKRLLKIR